MSSYYQDIQSEADEFLNEEALQKLSSLDSGFDFLLKTENEIPGEISFEEFKDDDYVSSTSQEEDS